MTERDWLVVGAEVVEVDWIRQRVGIPTTVERIGAREVRCADGRRYSAASAAWLAPVGASPWDTASLVDAANPRVAKVRREQDRRRALHRLILAVDAVRKQPSLTADALDGVQVALDHCRELLVDTEPDGETR